MRTNFPSRPASVLRANGGHIDHKITIVILLVLAAVAGARFWPMMPGLWSRFLMVTAAVVVGGVAGVVAAGFWSGGRALRLEPCDGGVVVRMPGAAFPAAGLVLSALALDFFVHGWIGEGPLWWGVAALGLAAALLGAFLVGWGERLVVEPGRVALESTLFGRATHATESRWELPGPPEVELACLVTGGAFGQPRMERYELRVGGAKVYGGTRHRAEALRDAVMRALAQSSAVPEE